MNSLGPTESTLLLRRIERLESELADLRAGASPTSNQHLDLALKAARLGTWDWDIERNRVLWGGYHAELCGMKSEEWDGTVDAFFHLVHPEDLPRVQEELKRCMDTRQTDYHQDYRLVWPDGTVRWFEASGSFFYDSEDTPVHMTGVLQDITAKKFADTQRRELESRFQSAFFNAPFGLVNLDASWHVQSVNEAFATSIGYSRQQLYGRDIRSLLHPADSANWESLLSKQAGERVRLRFVRQTGDVCFLDCTVSAAADLARTLFALDVTVNVQAEQLLDRSGIVEDLRELEAAYQAAPVGLCILDRDLRFKRINHALARANGVDVADHIGRTVSEVLPQIPFSAIETLRQVLETGKPALDIELTGSTNAAPGVVRVWRESWTPFYDTAGKIAGINVAAREITEEKQAQVALQRSEQHLRRLLSSLNAFVAVLSPEAIILECNEFPQDVLTDTTGPVIGSYFADAYGWVPAERSRVLRGLDECRQGRSSRFDVQASGARGNVFLDLSLVPLTDDTGEVTHLIASGIDISGRKRVEHELRDTTRRFEMAQRFSGLGVFDWDVVNDRSVVSKEWLTMYGFPPDHPPPTHDQWIGTMHPDDRSRVEAKGFEDLTGGNPWRDEFRVVWPDGTVRWLLSRGHSLRDEDGKLSRFLGIAVDVTDCKNAEERLQASEQRFRALVENFPHGIFVCAADGRVSYGNEWLRELGSEHPGAEPLPPELARAVQIYVRAVCENKQPFRSEVLVRSDVGDRHVVLTLVPLPDTSSNVLEVLGTVWEITARRRAEEAALRAEQGRQLALRAASMFGFEWDIVADRVTNDAYRQILCLEDVLNALHPHDRDHFAAALQTAMTQPDDSYRNNYRLIDADGNVRWFEEWGQFTCDEHGAPVRLSGVAQDVTEKRRAAVLLEESKARLMTLVESIPGIVFMAGPDGANIFTNRSLQEYSGFTAEQLKGFGWLGLVHPDDRQRTTEVWSNSVARYAPYELEYRLKRADGSYRWHLARGVPLLEGAGTEQPVWLGVCTDIDAQKQTEEALRRSNEDLQGFAYVASHDLQEPLRTLSALSTLLNRKFAGKLGTEADRLLEHIVDAAARMERLIQDLLAYSRVAGTTATGDQPVDLNDVFHTVCGQMRVSVEESGAVIESDTLPVVQGDPSQFVQLFQNLLSNSLKYAHGSRRPHIRISAQRREGNWHLSFVDNGQGFEHADAEYIFGIFNRLHGRDIAGTGIGLAIVKTIVERRGGKVWAESEPGKGATFHIQLPAIHAGIASASE